MMVMIYYFISSGPVSSVLFCYQRDQQIEKFGRFVRSMDDSIKHLYSVGENNAKKHQGRQFFSFQIT